jgi:zinc protease
MRKQLALLFCVLTLFSFDSHAAAGKAENFSLSNGMQVVIIPNHKVPIIAHMVWYDVGSAHEVKGKTGLAHFFEHLMFKGTSLFPSGAFSKHVAELGGNDNAFTSYDFTAYHQVISKESLKMIMHLEADRMRHLVIDHKEIDTEREVVLEERRTRVENRPSSQLTELMLSSLYGVHPYGRPVIGLPEDIRALGVSDAQDFYDRYYRPANAVLVVAGDITKEELEPLAEEYYGGIEAGEHSAPIMFPEVAEPTQKRVLLSDEKTITPEWKRFYLAPSLNDKTQRTMAYPLVVLAYTLGGSETSRLYQSLVAEKNVASAVSVSYDEISLDKTEFRISGMPRPQRTLDELEEAIEKEITAFLKTGITEAELLRAKNKLKAEEIYAKDGVKNLAFIYGEAFASGLGLSYVDHWAKNIDSVTIEQVNAAAKLVLDRPYHVTGVLLPKVEVAQ